MARQEKLERKLIQEPLSELGKEKDELPINKLKSSIDLLAENLIEIYREKPLTLQEFQDIQKFQEKEKIYKNFQEAVSGSTGRNKPFSDYALESLTEFAQQVFNTHKSGRTDLYLLFDMQPVYLASKLLSKRFNKNYEAELFLANRQSHPEFYNLSKEIINQKKKLNLKDFPQLEKDLSRLPFNIRFIDAGNLGTLPIALAYLSRKQGKKASYFIGTINKQKNYGGRRVRASYYNIESIGQAGRFADYKENKIKINKKEALQDAIILSLAIGNNILKE